jgi:hypothetical protein
VLKDEVQRGNDRKENEKIYAVEEHAIFESMSV